MIPTPTLTISRHAHPPRVPVLVMTDFSQLSAHLGGIDLARTCLFADLSLGAWRGHGLARDFCAQLDLPPPPRPFAPLGQIRTGPEDEDGYADAIAALIDAEGGGDRNIILAYDTAIAMVEQICNRAIRHVLIAAPLPGIAWGQDNLALVRMLAFAADQHDFTFALLIAPGRPLPRLDGLETTLIPGAIAATPMATASHPVPGLLLPEHVLNQDADLPHLRLANGRIMIAPLARTAPTGPIQLPLSDPALQAYSAVWGGPQDASFLQAQAIERFAEGSPELALTLLQAIRRDGLAAEQIASIDTQCQGIRIATMDFAAAAAGPLPPATLPAITRAWLYQSKAWGLVMTDQADAAEHCFTQAVTLAETRRGTRLYHYLLNIAALAKLRLGRIDDALALEQSIQQALERQDSTDWHIFYINCLNQARIHKKRGAYDIAEAYYHLAFGATTSLRGASDRLYVNLCLAQLESLRANPATALVYWLRAALHWLANPLPEALAPRVAQAVLGRPLTAVTIDVEAVSAALDQSLREAARAAGMTLGQGDNVPIRPLTRPGSADACVLGVGWSLCLGNHPPDQPAAYQGPAWDRLQACTLAVARTLTPDLDRLAPACLYVDDQGGCDVPATAREALWACARWQVPVLWHQGQRVPLTNLEQQLFARESIMRSPAIARILAAGAQRWAVFKRYRPALALSDADWQMLDRLEQPQPLDRLQTSLGMTPDMFRQRIAALFDQRLIQVA